MDRFLPDGTTERANLQAGLDNPHTPSPRARQLLLHGPTCPEHLRYLFDHAKKLVGRSSASGMNGAAPLSNIEIRSYSDNQFWFFEPWEVDVLMDADDVIRHPPPLPGTRKKSTPMHHPPPPRSRTRI